MIRPQDVVEYRKRRNLSRRQLASATGLTEGKIWRIENKGNISVDEEKLLRLVGVIPTEDVPQTPTPIVAPPPTPTPAPVIVSEPIEVDLADLAKRAERKYERYVSNSELQTFKRCRRKWWLAWMRGLRERHESPVGVRQIGNRGHRALAEHYVPGGPPSGQHLLDALERLIVLDRAEALQAGFTDETMKQFEKDADLERVMLEGYLQWLTETGADSDLKVIAPEAYLEVPLNEFSEGQVAIIGKLDVRVRRLSDNTILFLDHKFLAEFSKTTRLLPIMEQMIHYQLLETMSAEEGDHVSGALYNMIRRVKRTGNAQPPFYQRVEVQHNTHTLNNYRERLTGEISAMLITEDSLRNGASHQEIAYPTPTRDCYWDCAFLSVCSMFDDGSRAEDMLRDLFVSGDPLSYYMTEVIGENEL